MRFFPTQLQDAFLIEFERRVDDRGYFARTMCRTEFKECNLVSDFVQGNLSFNHHKATLRGMHFQRPPYSEVKLVQCLRGAIYDVIVDLRSSSSTFMRWEGFDLTADNCRSLYIPAGFAHGYMTLADDTAVTYQVSMPYPPQSEAGLRYDDPAVNIAWPLAVAIISEKDAAWPFMNSSKQIL